MKLLSGLAAALLAGALIIQFVAAQEGPGPSILAQQCQPTLITLWTHATEACVNKPEGYICNGGAAPQVEPAGPVANALAATGALVEIAAVDAIRTPRIATENGTAGIVWLRSPAPRAYTALMIGEVSLRDVSPPDFPAWTSFVVETSELFPTCLAAPLSALVLQNRLGQVAQIVVNGASLTLNGTVLIHTDAGQTTFVALSGASSVLTFQQQQPLLTGQQLSVPHAPGDVSVTAGPPSAPLPFDPSMLQNLPVALFDRPVVLPQPGNVSTQGPVNLRSAPSIDAGVITQVPGGELLSVLGRNSDGTWYHVRRDNGETGWMLAELLAQNVGPITAVYEATPLPPQRYGEFATRGRVAAPAGINLRTGPDAVFPPLATLSDGAVVNILARSPYSPWVKVESSGFVGWVALIALESQVYFEALPIDPAAPPLPEPTRIPGSFGNAFPDPNEPGS